MRILGGISLIAGITLIAGLIAYMGDRVGHQVGRRRLTLFGLRPKYTSTIVAVATGMMIAATVTVAAIAFSGYARAAFFHLSDLNSRVNQLQAEADELARRAHETNVIVYRGELLYDPYLLLSPTQGAGEHASLMRAFFDAVVGHLNAVYVPRGLKALASRSTDADTKKKLDAFLNSPEVTGALLSGPVLVLASADQNLFVNDPIHVGFTMFPDKRIFAKRQVIAAVEITGGTEISPRIAIGQLLTAVRNAAIEQGMPQYYAAPFPILTAGQVERMTAEIKAGRGKYRIVARAAQDIFPHTGGTPIEFVLSSG